MATKSSPLSAETVFQQCFDRLDNAVVGLNIPQGTISERLDHVSKICSNRSMQIRVGERLFVEVLFLEKILHSFSPDELGEELVENAYQMVFYTALKFLFVPRKDAERTFRQHWIPTCFLRKFSVLPRSRKGKAVISMFSVNEKTDGIKEQKEFEGRFVHRYHKDAETGKCFGFHHYSLEDFYGYWEGNFSRMMDRVSENNNSLTGSDMVIAFVFGLMSEIRKPDQNGNFTVTSISDFLKDFITFTQNYNNPCITMVFNTDHAVFSGIANTRLFTNKAGVTSLVFPLTPDTSVVVSDEKLSPLEAQTVVKRHKDFLIHNMLNGNHVLFGQSLVEN